jgi:hypothetical protein
MQDKGASIPLFCVVTLVEDPSWNSTQIAVSQGRLSLGLSQQHVEVSGLCLLINPNSLMSRWFLTFSQFFGLLMFQVSRNTVFSREKSPSPYLILRQRQRPRMFALKDAWQSGTRSSMYCRPSLFPSNFIAKTSFQSRTTILVSHTLSVCKAVCTS